ncbi:hypothetical protein EGW08_002993 [Elysia chlorotica]|uniref:G-protein coupled receptors family 1 profile domain-containing protein n=1 Tax=Elysia chlorotica TaxID=188477 RepID=A0A3S1CCV6_ELYCH|nr:hypothetical protein EGW08_002993 [Elysia chlorotica]
MLSSGIMPSPSWDTSVAWLCLCPVALLTDLLALAAIFHFRPLLHSVDVALASLFVTMAIDVLLLLPFPSIIRLDGDLKWTKEACTSYNWLASTLRASNILVLMLMNMYWVSALRTSPDPSAQSPNSSRIFSSSKLMKLAVMISWAVAITIGMVPVSGQNRVFNYYKSDNKTQNCTFLPYNTDIGYSLFFIIIAIASLFISVISAGDTLLLFRQMRRLTVTRFGNARRVSLPGHSMDVSQSEHPSAHAQHSELSVCMELCLVGFCVTLGSAVVNLLPFVLSQFIQLLHDDHDHVAMETTLLWLLLAEAALIPHVLWALSGRYRHAIRYLWRVYVLCDQNAKEEDTRACTLQAFRMKASDWSLQPYQNGSAPKQMNGNSVYPNGSTMSRPSSEPGPSGQNGRNGRNGTGKDPFVVKIVSLGHGATEVQTSSAVLELDDGMAVVSSLPINTGAAPLRLKDLSRQAQSSPVGMGHDHDSTPEKVHSFSADDHDCNESSPRSEQESSINSKAPQNKKLSPPGVWASRIAPRKGFNTLGPGGTTSQSTPNTPTKSLGVSPQPPPRRMGSSSSSGSSNSRVKRSASATSRQEWKERMRKKHLPAIFVNTSFEEDNIDKAVIVHSTPQQSSAVRTSQASSMRDVYDESEKNQVIKGKFSESSGHSPKSKDTFQRNSSVETTYFTSGEHSFRPIHALTGGPLKKKYSIAENEGMYGMYEDGDIDDILDEQVTNFSSVAVESARGTEQAKNFTAVESQPDVSFDSSVNLALLVKPQRKRQSNHGNQNPNPDLGIDNPAFDISAEGSLPGSADIGVFYDDTVISSSSETSHTETFNTSNVGSSEPSLVTEVAPTSIQATEVGISPGTEAAQTFSSPEETVNDGNYTTTQNQVLTETTWSKSPSTTTTQVSPASSQQSKNIKRKVSVSPSDLMVSSVDSDDDLVMPPRDFENPQNSKGFGVLSEIDAVQTVRGPKEIEPGLSQPSQAPETTELTSVSQDWGQLETVSGSEMILFKSTHVKAAAEVMVESSIDDEEDLDVNGDGSDEEVSSDGGQRVDEKEWASYSAANLASFSTRENLSEVGQVDYRIGSYDIQSKPSFPKFELKGEGDGAESVNFTPPHVPQNPGALETLKSNSSDENNLLHINVEKRRVKTSEQDTDVNIITSSGMDFNRPRQMKEPLDSRNSLLISQDSLSDSVFESEVDHSKSLSAESPLQSSESNLSNTNIITGVSSNSKSESKMNSSINPKPKPASVYSVIPKPVPSATPLIPPTQKPPRGVRRRNKGNGEVFDRLTSSEDELDSIFHEDAEQQIKPEPGLDSHTSLDSKDHKMYPEIKKESNYNNVSLNSANGSVDIPIFTKSDNSSTFDSYQNSNPNASSTEKGFSQVIVPLDHHHDPSGQDYSITLEPYGKRIPQWLEDADAPYEDISFPWSNNFSESQSLTEENHRPGLKFGKENIVYVDRIPEESTRELEEGMLQGPKNAHGVSSKSTVPPPYLAVYNSPDISYTDTQIEEYNLDSVDLDGDGDSRLVRHYQKNTRPSSSRYLKNNFPAQNLAVKYNHYPPAPPSYSSYQVYQSSSSQLIPQSPLTQYHFDEDIDRGFEEALSMDYHSLALPSAPSSMNSLFAPSFGLYFESITEEPEESLSLTEMAEASSLNGDNIFKTQAVISRPSSRASFTASTDNQLPELTIPNTTGNDSETPYSGSASTGNRTVVEVKAADYDPIEADIAPTSERTSADGSEAVEPVTGNGCHAPKIAVDSYASLPVGSGNPWGFAESSSAFNVSSSSNVGNFETSMTGDAFGPTITENAQENSPWLDLDIVVTHGPKGDNQLDMSFGSDFSSDHTLGESIDADGYEISEYDVDHSKQRSERKTLQDSYIEFEREARPSTPHQSIEKVNLDLNDHIPFAKTVISNPEMEEMRHQFIFKVHN